MSQAEALEHIRTLINAASEIDDIDLIRKHLQEMRAIVNNALPIKPAKRKSISKFK